MTGAPAACSPLITTARIERALDRLAQIITNAGVEGAVYLPIYDRLELELESARRIEARLASIGHRAGNRLPLKSI